MGQLFKNYLKIESWQRFRTGGLEAVGRFLLDDQGRNG